MSHAYPEKFIRDIVVAPFLQPPVVIVTLPTRISFSSNFGDRAFSAAGPRNYLPTDLRQPDFSRHSRCRQSPGPKRSVNPPTR